jgi:site-specific DNA-adenine methylase
MKLSSYLFICFFFISSFVCAITFAKEEILSITDNDDNKEIYNLVVNVDDSTQTLKNLYKDTFVDGKKIKRDELNPSDLKTKDGAILEKRNGYNVLNLKSDNLDYDRGGKVIIDTLYNGLTGERHIVDLELAKDTSGWKLFKEKRIVSLFHVKVNKVVVFGTVGIKTIIME